MPHCPLITAYNVSGTKLAKAATDFLTCSVSLCSNRPVYGRETQMQKPQKVWGHMHVLLCFGGVLASSHRLMGCCQSSSTGQPQTTKKFPVPNVSKVEKACPSQWDLLVSLIVSGILHSPQISNLQPLHSQPKMWNHQFPTNKHNNLPASTHIPACGQFLCVCSGP